MAHSGLRGAAWRPPALAVVGVLALVACASPLRSAGDAVHPTPRAASLERQVFELVNRHRRAQALPSLDLDARISREARRHSAAMAAGSIRPGHAGFDDRIAALRRVMPCRSSAENVASNTGYESPASAAVRGWLASRGHRANIEGPYDATGVGVAVTSSGTVYLTQIFVGR
jgi:uncharacterized protein YkwD